jgi:hypothetical protein
MLRLVNLPWTLSRQELQRILARTLDTRVRYSKILYDRDTGLSRGVGVVQLDSEQLTKDVVRRGTLNIDGRTVVVLRDNSRNERRSNRMLS